jgi:hypothetical protein
VVPDPDVFGRKYEPSIDPWHNLLGKLPAIAVIDQTNSVLVDIIKNKDLNLKELRDRVAFWANTDYDPMVGEYVTPYGQIKYDRPEGTQIGEIAILPSAVRKPGSNLPIPGISNLSDVLGINQGIILIAFTILAVLGVGYIVKR